MTLAVHKIKAAHGSRHKAKKVGRGNASGHGNYSGHGGKGQTARSGGGAGLRLKGFRRLMQSSPKLRGFKSIAVKPEEIYLSDLEQNFEANSTVNLATLKEKNLISDNAKAAKVIGSGELKKKLILEGIKTTASAKASIEKAQGEVK